MFTMSDKIGTNIGINVRKLQVTIRIKIVIQNDQSFEVWTFLIFKNEGASREWICKCLADKKIPTYRRVRVPPRL